MGCLHRKEAIYFLRKIKATTLYLDLISMREGKRGLIKCDSWHCHIRKQLYWARHTVWWKLWQDLGWGLRRGTRGVQPGFAVWIKRRVDVVLRVCKMLGKRLDTFSVVLTDPTRPPCPLYSCADCPGRSLGIGDAKWLAWGHPDHKWHRWTPSFLPLHPSTTAVSEWG